MSESKWIGSSLLFLCFIACRSWQDKDLYIPEIFFNEKKEGYIIVKNNGHTDIVENNILLTIYQNGQLIFKANLDTLDPHFRKAHDSSIFKIPSHLTPGYNYFLSSIDIQQAVDETDEDHNDYTRTILVENDSLPIIYPSPVFGLTYKKDEYNKLFDATPFANRVIWYEDDKPVILSFWHSDWKDLLLSKIKSYYTNPSISVLDSFDNIFSREEAFNIYLDYIAHAMVVDKESLVSWKTSDFEPTLIGNLWNSKNFFFYDSLHLNYEYNYENGGGIKIIHPIVSYWFAKSIVPDNSSQEITLTRLLHWMKGNLDHSGAENHILFQNPHFIYYPGKGNTHKINSCWATYGLLSDLGRSLNIPIIKKEIELYNGKHAGIYFPDLKLYFSHADDIYDPIFYTGENNTTKTTDMALPSEEYTTFINQKVFCKNDTCQTTGEQHSLDRRRYLVNKSLASSPASLYLKQIEGTLPSYLRGDEFPQLLVPVFSDSEQMDISSKLKKMELNKSKIQTLYNRYLDCKNNTR